jgi:hypothetical protein
MRPDKTIDDRKTEPRAARRCVTAAIEGIENAQ